MLKISQVPTKLHFLANKQSFNSLERVYLLHNLTETFLNLGGPLGEILKIDWRQFEMLSCKSLNLLIRTVMGFVGRVYCNNLLERCLRGWGISQ